MLCILLLQRFQSRLLTLADSEFIRRHSIYFCMLLPSVANNTVVPSLRASGKMALRSTDKHSQVTMRQTGGPAGLFCTNRDDNQLSLSQTKPYKLGFVLTFLYFY